MAYQVLLMEFDQASGGVYCFKLSLPRLIPETVEEGLHLLLRIGQGLQPILLNILNSIAEKLDITSWRVGSHHHYLNVAGDWKSFWVVSLYGQLIEFQKVRSILILQTDNFL